MYLHLGQNVVVSDADVIGIFDLDNTTGSRITRNFLNEAEKAGRVTSVSDDLPKSFVVCSEKRIIKAKRPADARRTANAKHTADTMRPSDDWEDFEIYLSQLSSQTLLKRSETMRFD